MESPACVDHHDHPPRHRQVQPLVPDASGGHGRVFTHVDRHRADPPPLKTLLCWFLSLSLLLCCNRGRKHRVVSSAGNNIGTGAVPILVLPPLFRPS